VWAEFGEGHIREWCSRGCVGIGFWREGGVVCGGDFVEATCGDEWCWRACAGGGFWGGVISEEWCCGGFWDGEVNPILLHRVFWEAAIPPPSLFYGETIDEEWVFRIISLRGHRMKFPSSSFSFSSPSFVWIVKVLELMTLSSHGRFDHCTKLTYRWFSWRASRIRVWWHLYSSSKVQ
jgi:hypothetical protein